MGFFAKVIITFLVVIAGAYFMPGIDVSNFFAAIVTAVVIALLNGIVKPILKFLAIPITILTLGLFLLVINAGMILLADFIVPGFYVSDFVTALIFGVILSVVTWLFDKKETKRK